MIEKKKKINIYIHQMVKLFKNIPLKIYVIKGIKNKNNKMNSDLELVNKEINQILKNEKNFQKEIQEKNIYS